MTVNVSPCLRVNERVKRLLLKESAELFSLARRTRCAVFYYVKIKRSRN